MLLEASRMASGLSKRAEEVEPSPLPLGPLEGLPMAPHPHGFEGRVLNLPAPRLKAKEIQGPRAYAPRISAPSP